MALPAAALIASLLPKAVEILDKFIPDKDAAQKAAQAVVDKVVDLTAQSDARQSAINEKEAASSDPFTSRARPFILWVCGAAFAWQYVLAPVAMWIGFVVGHPLPKPPTFDSGVWELMFGMLGLGGLRTYEKIKGVAR